ncbi:hypothetical protein Syun_011881 [Stephania yunnanensis]|uniref:Uncharacterized protein n=1 Tax=Stephania yunnanensis TaxID=152371 RepID=A0AAP0PIX4_9MAGN
MPSMESSTQSSPFEISCLANDFSLFSFLRTTSSSCHTIRVSLLDPRCRPVISLELRLPRRRHYCSFASSLHRSFRWPFTASRAAIRAAGSPLPPIVCPPAYATSAIAPSCWRLAKPSPVETHTITAVNPPPRLAVVAAAARLASSFGSLVEVMSSVVRLGVAAPRHCLRHLFLSSFLVAPLSLLVAPLSLFSICVLKMKK